MSTNVIKSIGRDWIVLGDGSKVKNLQRRRLQAHGVSYHLWQPHLRQVARIERLRHRLKTKARELTEMIAERPSTKSLGLGALIDRAEKGLDIIYLRLAAIEAMLEQAIECALSDQQLRSGQTLKVAINERTYWYAVRPNQWGQPRAKKIHWPDDDEIEIKIGDSEGDEG